MLSKVRILVERIKCNSGLNSPNVTKVPGLHLSNKARGGVVYGQYTTGKGRPNARCKAECLEYHTPKVPYCYYKLVTNVIRAVKINVLSYPWYTVCQPISVQGSNHPVYNYEQHTVSLVRMMFGLVCDPL